MQNPTDRHTDSAGIAIWIGSGVIWLGLALALWLGALAGGGRPHPFSLDWPFVAITVIGHSPLAAYWQLSGAPTLRSVPAFNLVAASVLSAETVIGLVVIAQGPAWIARIAPGLIGPQYQGWASRWHLGRLLIPRPTSGRVTLGTQGSTWIAAEAGVSVLVFGAPGSGKSTSLCIPEILRWGGPVLALSVKNDLVGACAGPRQRRGNVYVFDPTGMTEFGNCTWSPLNGCQDFDRAVKVADWMIQGVLAKGGQVGADMKDTHFKEAALRLLAVSLYIAACQGGTMADAAAWIDLPSGHELATRLQKLRGRDPRSVQWLASVLDRGPDERGSCFGTAQMMLRVYIEREVATATASSTFQPRDLLDGGANSLFVVAPKHDQRRLASIFTGIVMSVLEEASATAERDPSGRLPRPLLVVLDELANTAPIDQLPQYLSTARSEGIVFIAIFQDLSQAEGRYGPAANTIVNNARARLFLSALSDPKTLELMNKLLGHHQTRRLTRDDRGRTSTTDDRQDLLPLSAGRLIPDGRAVLLYSNLPPTLLTLRYWFREKSLRQLVAANPLVRGVISVGPNSSGSAQARR